MNYYKIAGLTMGLEYANIMPMAELSDYEVDKTVAGVDIEIEIDDDSWHTQRLLDDQEQGVRCFDNELVIIYELDDSYTMFFQKPRGIVGCRMNKESGKATIYPYEEKRSVAKLPEGVKEVGVELTRDEQFSFCVREIFYYNAQKAGRIAVHSASHIYNEKAWLFSAQSGVGKTSHVQMWKAAGFDIEDLNGDVTMCYLENDKPVAAGLPWSGSSGINHNRKIDLGGVFFLEQANLDKVTAIEYVDTVLRLNARCFTPNWDSKLVERNIDNAMEIAKHIKSYYLECTLSTEAAQMAKNAIDLML